MDERRSYYKRCCFKQSENTQSINVCKFTTEQWFELYPSYIGKELINLEKKNNIEQTEHVDEYEKKLRQDYPDNWIEIQDFTIGYNTVRFAHVFYGKTFLCTSWKLFAEYKWEIQKTYSNDLADSPITPCSFNVEKTDNQNVFLIDFCLAPGWWSGECLGQEMYYNFIEKTWKKWKLFYPEYPNGEFKKFLI